MTNKFFSFLGGRKLMLAIVAILTVILQDFLGFSTEQLELIVTALGLSTIGLHVFGHNRGARALYAKLGYGVTGINMMKNIGETRASRDRLPGNVSD